MSYKNLMIQSHVLTFTHPYHPVHETKSEEEKDEYLTHPYLKDFVSFDKVCCCRLT